MFCGKINSKITPLVCIFTENLVNTLTLFQTAFIILLLTSNYNPIAGILIRGCDSNHTMFGLRGSDATPSHTDQNLSCFKCSTFAPPHMFSSRFATQHSPLPNKGPKLSTSNQTIYTVCMSWCSRGICCGLKLHACILTPRWQYWGVRQSGHTHPRAW